jgi:uncharacterized protein (TIGR00369 family)
MTDLPIDLPTNGAGPSGRGDAFAQYLGLRWDDPSTVRLTIRPDLVNDVGLLLGPVGFALVDYAMGSTLWQQTTDEESIATVNIAINYIQSADQGDVRCHAELNRRNRRIAVLTSETHHEDGRLLATAIGSFSIYPRRTRPATG